MNPASRRRSLLLLILIFASFISGAQVTQAFTTSGTFTVPQGVTSVNIKVWGGGGGTGGQDCGAGCSNAVAGNPGYISANYTVSEGTAIAYYPGGKGTNGSNSVTNTGGGAGGTSPYNATYNGGRGGNAGPSGTSGGGGGGGAASIVLIGGNIRIVAGGAGGGGGMANLANSGRAGISTYTPNGTSNTGGAGSNSANDGGGGGAGGGGYLYGGIGGTTYNTGSENAGNGGYRGNNYVNAASSTITNGTTAWTNAGRIEITYTPVGGTASSNQTICSGNQPANITLSGSAGTIQWQVSTNNSTYSDISGATSATLTSAQMGALTATRYYRAYLSSSVFSNVVTVTVNPVYTSIIPSGSGTIASPYQVANFANLQWISEDASRWDKHYIQTANIDAAGTSGGCYNGSFGWSAIGNGTTQFTGTYNGQYFTISNLYLNRGALNDQGLFGISSGTIEQVRLTNASIRGFNGVGAIAGKSSGTVIRCSAEGTVTGNGMSGVLLGTNEGTLSNSFSTGTMTGANYYIGGLAGVNNGSINNSYSSANVTGQTSVGGLVGSNSGPVDKSYSYGSVTGTTNTGGLVGTNGSTVTNSFWNTQTSGQAASVAGTPKTTAELKNPSTFFQSSWDLKCEITNGTNDYWGLNPSAKSGYPFLSWENFTAQCPEWTGTVSNDPEDGANWIGGYKPEDGMDFIINGSATRDLILSKNLSINNLTFNNANRNIILGNYNLTISGNITNSNSLNRLRTNGTGLVGKLIPAGMGSLFPVGNSAYNPVSVFNNTGVADIFTVGVLDEVYLNGTDGATIGSERVRRTWIINKSNTTSSGNVNLNFYWNNGETSSTVSSPAVFHYTNNWHRATGTESSLGNSFTLNSYSGALTRFSIVQSNFTLPVRLLDFSARKQDNNVLLSWNTSFEQGSDLFYVQHSKNGTDWKIIGQVKAAGNSSVNRKYQHVHNDPVNGLNYYRLIQKDLDGKTSLSNVQSVNFVGNADISVFPNPATNYIRINNLSGKTTYHMISENGSVIRQGVINGSTGMIDTRNLAAGTYQLKMINDKTSKTVQVLIVR
jgi:hypothetical protein